MNFSEEIWAWLKTWAAAQASLLAEPSLDECETYVRRACREIAGEPRCLPPDAISFYARETRDMIAKHRAASPAETGVA